MNQVNATRCTFVAKTKIQLLQLVAFLQQKLIFSYCGSLQKLLQKHHFMFVRRVAKTLSYNPYFLRAVAGVRSLAPRGGREAPPTPIGCDRHAPPLQMDARKRG